MTIRLLAHWTAQLTCVPREVFWFDRIFIPPNNLAEPGIWLELQNCVWDGPAWFEWKTRLAGIPEYTALYSLFKITLQIPDANLDDFLDLLQDMRVSDLRDISDVDRRNMLLIYGKLSEETFMGYREVIRYVH
jgi:hypothetical protein